MDKIDVFTELSLGIILYLNKLILKFIPDFTIQLPDFLRSYQNYQSQNSDPRALTFIIFILLIFLVGIALVILLRFIWNFRISNEISEFQNKAENYLKNRAIKQLNELNATQDQINIFFSMMGHSDNFTTVIENPNTYQRYLENYKNLESNPQRIKIAESLRQTFNFNFNNIKVDFNNTRLLPERMKVRIYLHKGQKKVDYLSSITKNQHNFLFILPPKRKGIWLRIDSFKELEMRVFRENDSEYQIICTIFRQTDDIIPEVVLYHSNRVLKINTREYKRYNISVKCRISPFSDKNLTSSSFTEVQIKDLSQGGACIIADKDLLIKEKDVIEIQLPASNIKSLFARVITVNRFVNPNGIILNIEFTGITFVERLLIDRFIQSKITNIQSVKKT